MKRDLYDANTSQYIKNWKSQKGFALSLTEKNPESEKKPLEILMNCHFLLHTQHIDSIVIVKSKSKSK